MPFTYEQQATDTPQAAPSTGDPSKDAAMAEARQSGADAASMARGAAKAITGVVTLPADAGMWVGHKIANAAGLGDGSDEYTDAGDLVNRGLDAVGIKAQPGARGTALELAGGLAGAGRQVGSAVSNDASQFWRMSGVQGGRNQEIAAQAIGDAIGEPGIREVTPEVLKRASDRIDGAFDAAWADNKIVQFDPKAAIKNIIQLSDDITPADGALVKSNIVVKAIKTLQKGYANNEDLGALSSQLGKAAKSAVQKDYDLGTGIYKVKDQIDNLISDGLVGGEKAAYDAARSQYRSLWSVVLARSGHVNPAGESDISAIGRHLFRLDPQGYMLGENQSPLYQVARAAQGAGDNALNLMQQTAASSTGTLKKLAQKGPQVLQYMMQQGGPRFVEWASRQPGAVTAVGDAAEHGSDE